MKEKVMNRNEIIPMSEANLDINKMIDKIYKERTPEGLYENYKWYISESVELWVKNRDNDFYNN